jgi:hypothetical protein
MSRGKLIKEDSKAQSYKGSKIKEGIALGLFYRKEGAKFFYTDDFIKTQSSQSFVLNQLCKRCG